MSDAHAPILASVVPLRAVPERLRVAVTKVLTDWGYSWEQVTFAGTAELGHGREVWVFAVTSGPLSVGDELEAAGGRAAGIGVSAFSGGVIPVTPYQARVYECLGRHGGGPAPEREPPPSVPTTPETEPATQGRPD